MLSMTGTRYVITQAYRAFPTPKGKALVAVPPLDPNLFAQRFEDIPANVRVYSLNRALQRAYLSYDWRSFESDDELLTQIFEAEKSNFDPSRTTLIHSANISLPAPLASPSLAQSLELIESHPERVELKVNATGPALAVLADQIYPGWAASVDGKPAEILRCNGFLRAVPVPAGQHTVVFEYRPMSLYAGFALAGVGLFCCWWLWVRRRYRI
jgi:hypothetical protein